MEADRSSVAGVRGTGCVWIANLLVVGQRDWLRGKPRSGKHDLVLVQQRRIADKLQF